MERKRNVGLIVAGLIFVLLIIPYSRQVIFFQLRLGVTPYHMLDDSDAPPLAIKEQRAPSDVDEALLVAKYKAMKSKSINIFDELTARFPDEPALYASMLRYAAMSGPLNGPARPEIDTPAKGEYTFKPLADTPDVQMLENAVEMGRKLEPENSYFHWFEAVLRFRQVRDADALAAIHCGAQTSIYNAHTREEVLSEFREYRQRVGGAVYLLNPTGRAVKAGAILLPHLGQFARVSRMVAWCIGQDVKAGKKDEALALMLDHVKFAAVMRDNSLWVLDALVAIANQKIAIAGAYKAFVGPLPEKDEAGSKWPSEDQMLSQIQTRIPNGLGATDWKYLHNQAARSAEFRTRSEAWFNGNERTKGLTPLAWSASLLVLEGVLLLIAVLFGVSSLVWGFWLGRGGGSDLQAGPHRLSIWMLAILPPIMAGTFALKFLFLSVIYPFVPSPESSGPRAILWITPCFAVIMGSIVLIIAASGIGARDRGDRFTTFLARLRAGSAYAAQCVLIVYVAAMIAGIPITVRANEVIDQFTTTEVQHSEVQQVWQYKMPGK